MNNLNIKVDDHVFYRALGTTFKVLTETVAGSAGIVEHTLEPMSLGAPMHKHTREDEISFVLEGQLSVIQDGKIQTATAGQFIAKPRNLFHTFWNATEQRIRFVEFIVPGTFQYYFAELEPFLRAGQQPDFEKMKEVREKYGLIVDPHAADEIIKQFGLKPLG
mgnify:CR=1 FL=1